MEESKKRLLDHVLSFMNEETDTNNIAGTDARIGTIVKRLYPDTLVSLITDVQELKGPSGYVYSLVSTYGGKGSNASTTSSKIIQVSDATGLTVDQEVINGLNKATILYIEGNTLIILITEGSYSIGDTFDTTTITYESINRTFVRKMLKNYTGAYTSAIAEDLNGSINTIDFEVKRLPVDVVERKVKSTISKEAYDDINRIHNEHALDIIKSALDIETNQEIDMEIMDYIKTIAKTTQVIVLSNSIGTQSQLSAIAEDIFAAISLASQDIIKNTRRSRNCFVIVSRKIAALLLTSPLQVNVTNDNKNPYNIGMLGTFPLYFDPYSEDDYALVGYKSITVDGTGDAGLIYAPYNNTTSEPIYNIDVDFINIFHTRRYGYVRNPQDTGNFVNDSDFFIKIPIDITALSNFPIE